MKLHIDTRRMRGERNPMIYGQFIEHFHRQIYGGVYDPSHPCADADGLRTDVLDAMRHLRIPVLRWPGGCFVSSHHWKDAVGPVRTPSFDKSWRVEDPNTFGTDEYVAMCRKIGCQPYICTNAGTGTAEEMSDWVEYCNLESEGRYARQRIQNGNPVPHGVKYWSIGNENYGSWELGAKSSGEWGRLVREAAKMIRRVDPTVELTAAALDDLDWNVELLQNCGEYLQWISIHEYWDKIQHTNEYGDYSRCMSYTVHIEDSVKRVRGLLTAMGLEKKVKIAFDEWNLRGWYHPNIHTVSQGLTKEEYLYPRDLNDDNSRYTMADAVFSACFLNMCNRNCDIVGMANFAPVVNTRGCIFTHADGVVLRSTYHVFDLYCNQLEPVVLDTWVEDSPTLSVSDGSQSVCVETLDALSTFSPTENRVAIAVVNKHPCEAQLLQLDWQGDFYPIRRQTHTLAGSSTESYNDINHEDAIPVMSDWQPYTSTETLTLPAHSITIIRFEA